MSLRWWEYKKSMPNVTKERRQAKRWWETKRKRNEKGHFVKKERPLWREAWWNLKKAGSKIVDAIKNSPIVPGSKSD